MQPLPKELRFQWVGTLATLPAWAFVAYGAGFSLMGWVGTLMPPLGLAWALRAGGTAPWVATGRWLYGGAFLFLGALFYANPGNLLAGITLGTAGRVGLSLSFLAIGGSVLWLLHGAVSAGLERILLTLGARARRVGLVLGWVGVGALALDLFFVSALPRMPHRLPRYHPWGVYDVEGSYLYSHARERWVKDFRGRRFEQQRPADTLRVVLNGASTAFGFLLPTDAVPAARLEAFLTARLAPRKVEVISVAYPGKFQLNEAVDAAVTLPHWNPHVVVSWNGWNELVYGERDDRYVGMPYIAGQLEAVLDAYPWGVFFTWSHGGRRYFHHLLQQHRSSYGLREVAPGAVPRYLGYLQRTARLLKSEGISYLYSFTPNVVGLDLRHPASETAELPARAEVLKRASAAEAVVKAEGQIYLPLEATLEAGGASLFQDDCHLTSEGVERAVTLVGERLLSVL